VNPWNRQDFKNLTDAVDNSYRSLKPFREKRKDGIREFCGSEYADTNLNEVYLNLLALYTTIIVLQVAARAPTAKITTAFSELRPTAHKFEMACNLSAREAHFSNVLRMAVTDSLFSPLATVKMGLRATGETEEIGGEKVDLTEKFVTNVSFDDYVRDMDARSAYNSAFEGDRYFMDLDLVLKRYPKASGLITAGDSGPNNSDSDRAEGLSHEQGFGSGRLRKQVEMQDIFLHRERMLVTYIPGKGNLPLEVVQYENEEEDGPYRSLWYTPVPDNAMPLPPIGLLKNIQKLVSSTLRRLSSQAEKQKNVVGFENSESAERFQNAKDGDAIFWKGAEKPINLQAGGVNQQTFALMLQLRDLFSWAGGNIDSLGGLSAMSETLGQDELLAQSASGQVRDMQEAASKFAKSVFRQLAWYEWTDPIRERTLEQQIAGTTISIPVKWSKETKRGDFLDFNFNINVQSMRDDDPALKIKKIMASLSQIYFPGLPMMQQQGLTLDFRKITSLLADYSNIPELEQIIISIDPALNQQQTPAGNPNPVAKPAQTNRTYTRINRPGATRPGKDKALSMMMSGMNIQGAEAEAAGRPG